MVIKSFFRFFDRILHPAKKFRSKKRKAKRYKRKALKHRKKPVKRIRRVMRRVKKIVRKGKTVRSKRPLKESRAVIIGFITHYFPKVNAAVVKLKKPLLVGEPIWVKGKITDFKQTVGSMQINRQPIDKARAGQEIGLEVFRQVRPGDSILRGR